VVKLVLFSVSHEYPHRHLALGVAYLVVVAGLQCIQI
jgi:hypothetical protein